MKNFSAKKVVLVIIAGIVGIFGIIGLAFRFIFFESNGVIIKDTGFSLLGFNSKFLEKGGTTLIASGIVCYLILILSLISCFNVLRAIFKGEKEDKAVLDFSLILGNLATLLILVIGLIDLISYKNTINDNTLKDIFHTQAFIPFLVTAVLTVAYIICLEAFDQKVLKKGTLESSNELKEEQKLSLILKYKELLNEGIITKQEFEEKKKKLLLTENPKEEQKNSEEEKYF